MSVFYRTTVQPRRPPADASSINTILRFTGEQLDRLHMRMHTPHVGASGDADDPIEVSSDEEAEPPPPPSAAGQSSSSSTSSVQTINVPASDLRLALQVRESRIVAGQPGLFSTTPIPANSLVTVYTYSRAVLPSELLAMGNTRRDAVNRYAVEGPNALTFILNLPVDYATHPAAAANEPADGTSANMSLHVEQVSLPNGDVYHLLALYTCNAAVAGNTELTWHYGRSYREIRTKERYSAGRPCTSKDPLSPSLEDLAQRIVAARGADGVDGILWKLDDDSSSSDSSDEEFRGRGEPQARRVQPRRARS